MYLDGVSADNNLCCTERVRLALFLSSTPFTSWTLSTLSEVQAIDLNLTCTLGARGIFFFKVGENAQRFQIVITFEGVSDWANRRTSPQQMLRQATLHDFGPNLF